MLSLPQPPLVKADVLYDDVAAAKCAHERLQLMPPARDLRHDWLRTILAPARWTTHVAAAFTHHTSHVGRGALHFLTARVVGPAGAYF